VSKMITGSGIAKTDSVCDIHDSNS
jgi:hypothetical protein